MVIRKVVQHIKVLKTLATLEKGLNLAHTKLFSAQTDAYTSKQKNHETVNCQTVIFRVQENKV